MSGDILSDVLRAVRLRGAVYFTFEGQERWTAEAPAAHDLIPAVMPEAEHLLEFHGLVSGSCWAFTVPDGAPVRLEAQDVILFPQGDAHVVASEPGLRPRSTAGLADAWFGGGSSQPLPKWITVRGEVVAERSLPVVAAEGQASVVCGFLGFDARPFNPLLAALPRVLKVSGATLGPDSWVTTFLRTAAAESALRRPGSQAVLERMSEMLFVEVLRRHLEALPPDETGWLAGIHDPVVGPALAMLHAEPAAGWTIDGLADAVHASRSGLAERFTLLVGHPPMQYLARWRMQLASGMLRDSGATVSEIAVSVGYDSEAAFSRAFKRIVGVAPSAWRAGVRPSQPVG
ncbi:MAG: AraC family transcriptional regulator [Chloroflexota bacterium]